jgi:hypothetical protein
MDEDAIIIFEAGKLVNIDVFHLIENRPALGGSVRARKLITARSDFNDISQ